MRPEIEIDDSNFEQVELLGTLGSGTPVHIQFSPDDSLLAFATSVGDVYIYDTRTLELIQNIKTNLLFQLPTYFHAYSMCDLCGRVAISPDNKMLGVFSIVGDIQIWDLESQQQLASSTEIFISDINHRRLSGEGVSTGRKMIRFSDDGQYLGVFGEISDWWPPGACLYALEEQCERNFERPYFILSISGSAWSIPLWCGMTPCPTVSSVELRDDLSQFYEAFTFSHENWSLPPIPLPETMNGKTQYQGKRYLNAKQQYISSDGSHALSYDSYGVVNNFPRYGNSEVIYAGTIWNVPNNQVINTFSFPYVDVYSFSHDLGIVAYVSPMGITVLDIQSGSTRGEIQFSTCLGKLTFSPDGSILVGYYRNIVYFCDPLTGVVNQAISVPTGHISSVAFSPDGKFLASTGQTLGNYLSTSEKNYDPFVYIWNISEGTLVTALEHHGDTMIAEFSSDGKYIATGAGVDHACSGMTTPKDESFILWSWDGHKASKLIEREFPAGVGNIDISSDNKQLLLATNRSGACYLNKGPEIFLYDIDQDIWSRSPYHAPAACGSTPNLLRFFLDGRRFLIGGECRVTKLTMSADILNTEFVPTYYFASSPSIGYDGIAVSPNWSVMALLTPYSNRITITDITGSRSIEIPREYGFFNLTFSPDGKVIYGGSNTLGVISVWSIPVQE